MFNQTKLEFVYWKEVFTVVKIRLIFILKQGMLTMDSKETGTCLISFIANLKFFANVLWNRLEQLQ